MLGRLSLRTKFFLCLIVIPMIALAVFLTTAVRVFEQDKIAYIYESSMALSRAAAPEVRLSIEQILSEATLLISGFNVDRLSDDGNKLFEKDARLAQVSLYAVTDDRPRLIFSKSKGVSFEKNSEDKVVQSLREGLLILPSERAAVFRLLQPFKNSAGESLVAELYIHDELLIERFRVGNQQHLYLIDRSGRLLLPNDSEAKLSLSAILDGPIAKGIATNATGAEQVEITHGKTFLVSYADVGFGNLEVVSSVDRQVAKSAISLLVSKTVVTFLFIILLTVLISVGASSALTKALRFLTEATGKIAKGDFNIRLSVRSQDELGKLSEGFNAMAGEVSRLVKETAEKSRMQSELETARRVQEMLFPPSNVEIGSVVEISGFFEPASECSGDWWYYFEDVNHVYVWIGDATGHGVAAALLTSAARSAVATIHSQSGIEPAEAMRLLNSAIYQTSKGSMMMTFFLGRIEKATGRITYTNASHEPVMLLRDSRDQSLKEQFVYLDNNNNPRIGESINSVYSQSEDLLGASDKLFLYTDGAYDLRNSKGRELGFRRLKSLFVVDSCEPPSESLARITGELAKWRGDNKLNDDVTIAVVSFRRQSVRRLAS